MVDLDKATKERLEAVRGYIHPDGFEDNQRTRVWRIICFIAQIILGCTFIFSGLVKGIDPMGTAIKISEYASSFGFALPEAGATFLAVALNTIEGLLGFCLILGVTPRLTGGLSLLVMSTMTLLTLYIVIYNPVKDCGCFGDALKISNTQTFIKNLILLPLALLLWVKRSRWARLLDEGWDPALIVITILLLVNFNIYPLRHLPVVDFRPYKVGSDLQELTLTGGSDGEYEYLFVYEKDGKEQTFGMDELETLDDSWTYVRDETKVIKEAEQPKGADLVLLRENGTNAMETLAYDQGHALLLISPDLTKVKRKLLDRIVDFQKKSGVAIDLVISNSGSIWESKYYEPYEHAFREILFLDKTTAKTVIRSNPGLVVIDKGNIVRKISGYDLRGLLKESSFVNNPFAPLSAQEQLGRYLKVFAPWVLYVLGIAVAGILHQVHRRQLRQTSINNNKPLIS